MDGRDLSYVNKPTFQKIRQASPQLVAHNSNSANSALILPKLPESVVPENPIDVKIESDP